MSASCRITEGRHYDVDPDTGCWNWKLSKTRDGYGRAARMLAHRRSFIEHGGVLDAGEPLDHLCRNRACVNPDHLEVVTIGENNRRSLEARGFGPDRTVCSHGHSLVDAYVEPGTGRRKCRVCRRQWAYDWFLRNRDGHSTVVEAVAS